MSSSPPPAAPPRTLELLATGDADLDAILGGGLPARSVNVIAGDPGSGKTILALQMLFRAARLGRPCLYFTTLSEPAVKLLRYAQLFDFFEPERVGAQIHFVDLGAVLREGARATLDLLAAKLEEHEPTFVVIDSFSSVQELLPEGERPRAFVYELAVQMAGWGATTLLLGDYPPEAFLRAPEFSIADGIVRLGTLRQELTAVREMEVLKLRGAAYQSGRHFFEISAAGVSFFPRVRSPDVSAEGPAVTPGERASTGVGGLDALLGGGLPRASNTIVQGGTGTGKTLLGLQFLIEGARRGEKGVYFSLEETPQQLRGHALGLGWDLAALEREGNLVIHYTSPVELSTDRFLHQSRRQVEQLGARRAVFDSMTSLGLGVASERRFKELTYSVAKHLHQLGVTLLMLLESEVLLGAASLSAQGISFVADNVIQLRYLELDGRLERALSVLKARGIKQATELRAMHIGQGGVRVAGERFRDLRGVLTGLPTPVTGPLPRVPDAED